MVAYMKGSRRIIADMADRFLSITLLSDQNDARGSLAGPTHIAARYNLWNCDFHILDPNVDAALQPHNAEFIDPDNQSSALAKTIWPIDFGTAVWKEDHLQLHRITTVEPKDVRGYVTRISPRMALLSAAFFYDDGKFYAEQQVCALFLGRWCDVSPMKDSGVERTVGPEHNNEIAQTVGITTSVALTERYNWHIAFAFAENGPRIVFPTNPASCLALVKDRWKEAHMNRRAALRHWVETHYRQHANDPDALVYIRTHLRGATKFIWNGLFCEILVSAYDLEKNELFRTQAAEWRANRKHNRVKLRLKSWSI